MAYVVTSRNSVITFTPDIDPANQITLKGFSKDYIMRVSDADNATYDIGIDGQSYSAVITSKVDGTFSFIPLSPTLLEIQVLQTAIYLTGIPVTGTLSVNLVSQNISINYREFTILSAVKGFDLGTQVDPIVIKWSSQLPVVTVGA